MSGRIVCRFSCGAASAVATKLVLGEYPPERVVILNAFLKREHSDNGRFLADCEKWFGHPIIQCKNDKYNADPHEVWRKKRFMVSRLGAPCSIALKRDAMEPHVSPNDIMVLGYTIEEQDRLDAFIDRNADTKVIAPLIERGLGKADCLAILQNACIDLPTMYKLGFNNNNCIGCPKGGMGYWNRIRQHFPDDFEAVAAIQDILGPGSYFFRNHKTGERFGLRQLPLDAGRHDEPEISCSAFCILAEDELNHSKDKANV